MSKSGIFLVPDMAPWPKSDYPAHIGALFEMIRSPCLSRSPNVINTKQVQTNNPGAMGVFSCISRTRAGKHEQTNFLRAMGLFSCIWRTRASKPVQTTGLFKT
ncbi:uncharacterized protein LACBIDRAFT_313085 [Laccaria bicolor S238N-H82]|uniref:Predicted protein n=1 Tax=Laccaria bicolor (strain S238N-H82 / ATCC MYA-4686) TaxID=486041 RepID=B0DXH8_LACBS|nr:uncharacterized protein LACBIDRAFT_313085 [Laccaria bicolor S238N-H82]EDR00681.1 predicted protein [Laccaria bicolor S238N-H82]|eukprot:XP_001888690.1 predicted protein [Laccaria bicolor S238N-H82]